MNFDGIFAVLQDKCLLNKEKPILVGVSGGPDSLFLLDFLKTAGYNPAAAVYDHQLRPSSAEEVNLVRDIALRLKTPFFSGFKDVKSFAEENKLCIEEAARICRYIFLFEKARELSAQAVAVAHHADDQVETVLMHFLRGTGLGGLRGMAYRQISEWDVNIPIVRPLLDVWKEEIEIYCKEKGIDPVRDETNQDILYFRNRIRNDLLPQLSQYNPGIKNVLWRMAETIQADEETLNELTEKQWQKLKTQSGAGFVSIDLEKFTNLSKGLQRRLVRKAFSELKSGLRDVDFDAVERVMEFIKRPSRSSRMELSKGTRLLLQERQLIILDEDGYAAYLADLPKIGALDLFTLDMPGELALLDKWVLSAEYCPQKPSCETLGNAALFEVFLDADTLGKNLLIRSRRAGDRFQPLGMDGRSQKISDFFINEKMVLEARDRWPLVLTENKIVWIPGYRPAHFCRTKESTRKFLRLKLSRIN